MYWISNSEISRNILIMNLQTFLTLCDMLKKDRVLRANWQSNMEQQVAKSIYILTYNVKNCEVNICFRPSENIINHHFHQILRAIIELEEKFLV